MQCRITQDVTEGGDPRRGYYNNTGTIAFEYPMAGGGRPTRYTEEKERAVVDAMLTTNWMWYTVTKLPDEVRGTDKQRLASVYQVNYGYDSGD